VGGEHGVQSGDPLQSFRESDLGQLLARIVLQFYVVMVLGPVVPDEQHAVPHLLMVLEPNRSTATQQTPAT